MEPCEWRCSHHSCPVVCGSVSPRELSWTSLLSSRRFVLACLAMYRVNKC
jgi:hypothetical protein